MDQEWTNPSSLNLDLNIGQSSNVLSVEHQGWKIKWYELNEENKRLIKKIEELMDFTVFPPAERSFWMTRKRKMENTEMNTFSESILCGNSCKRFKEEAKPNAHTTYTIVDASDSSLTVRDGYHWKKYGQKVTKDNPSPRAYFRCSYAPSCPVKKKVQKSVKDRTVLVTTYQGKHNHCRPSSVDITEAVHENPSHLYFVSPRSSDSTVTVDLGGDKDSEFQRVVAEKMASSLTKDPNFTAALASAISGRIQLMQVQN